MAGLNPHFSPGHRVERKDSTSSSDAIVTTRLKPFNCNTISIKDLIRVSPLPSPH